MLLMKKKSITTMEAISRRSDYLVIGRAITEAKKPESIVEEIVKQISPAN